MASLRKEGIRVEAGGIESDAHGKLLGLASLRALVRQPQVAVEQALAAAFVPWHGLALWLKRLARFEDPLAAMSGYRQERDIPGHGRARQQEVKPMRSPLVTGTANARRRNLEKSEVTVFMREIGLPQYAELLRDHGFEDMETLLGIEEQHMRDMGMPAGHIVKMKRNLRECPDRMAMAPVQVTSLARPLQAKGLVTGSHMTAVQMSWQQVKQLGTDVVGGLFYKKFFMLEPSAKALFPMSMRLRYKDWDTDEEEGEDPSNSPALRKLWAKFITVVGSAVAGIQDTARLVPMLQALGMRHVGYGLKSEYFDLAGKVLIEVLAEWLGEGFTKEVENAWVMVSGFMVATMHGGFMSASGEIKAKERQILAASLEYSPPESTAGSDFERRTEEVALERPDFEKFERAIDLGEDVM